MACSDVLRNRPLSAPVLANLVSDVDDVRCKISFDSITWGSISEGIVLSKTKPVLAKAIETTPEALIVILEIGSVSIPWEWCSESLARASFLERSRVELSPSGYGIHWPLIDEDLAVGPLVRATA
jgi:hypothetical protein